MTMPCGGVVNDYVPFYFSPITAMAYTIYMGNVELKLATGEAIGTASMDDRIFFVCNVHQFYDCEQTFYFSDLACNSMAPPPSYECDLNALESHIEWSLFDEAPIVGNIQEISYSGVCRYFNNRDVPKSHQNRSRQRMAEFLVKDQFSLGMVDCIVVKSEQIKVEVDVMLNATHWNIPVVVKPGCYF